MSRVGGYIGYGAYPYSDLGIESSVKFVISAYPSLFKGLGSEGRVVSIASETLHTCAVQLDWGQIKCLGKGTDGNLGTGSVGKYVGASPGSMGDSLVAAILGCPGLPSRYRRLFTRMQCLPALSSSFLLRGWLCATPDLRGQFCVRPFCHLHWFG